MQQKKRLWICLGSVIVTCFVFVLAPSSVFAQEPVKAEPADRGEESGGTISVNIKVWRTKVKTGGSKSSGDVVVFLEKVGGKELPAPSEHVKLDQRGLVFIPHVLAIQKGTTVDFLNSDHDNHNVYFLHDASGETEDVGTWAPGQQRSRRFDKPGMIIVLCKLHLEMAAYLVILENPYFTVAKIDGETQQAVCTIENVPPGKYVVNTWHKKLTLRGGGREVVVVNGKTATLDLEITKAKYAKK